MTHQTFSQALTKRCDQESALLTHQLQEVMQQEPHSPSQATLLNSSARQKHEERNRIPPQLPFISVSSINALSQRIDRLTQIRDWILNDAELARLIDDTIGQKVKEAERHQNRFTIFLTLFSLVVGWLLSIFGTPNNLLHLVGK